MNETYPEYNPVTGKTYSLFAGTGNTSGYYSFIRSVVNQMLEEGHGLDHLLVTLRKKSKRKGLISLIKRKSKLLHSEEAEKYTSGLEKYTINIIKHLQSVPLFTSNSSVIRTTEEQYHLYMLEIEVTNRLYIDKFKAAPYRFALLPHCLRDIWDDCQSEVDGVDYVCRHCNKDCYLNHISRILKEHDIKPYIWTTRNLKKLFKKIHAEHPKFAVLGVACIPELIMGMRRSTKRGIPAVGIPLNANCCVRWFGEYRENSVDLGELERLIR
jgi:hypothetical protein